MTVTKKEIYNIISNYKTKNTKNISVFSLFVQDNFYIIF